MKTALSLLLCLSMCLTPLSGSTLSETNCIAPALGMSANAALLPPPAFPPPPECISSVGWALALPSEEFCDEAARKALAQEICDFAVSFTGCDYVWGGTSPDTGFDCSGFVWYVYGHFGYELNRIAQDQALDGVHVEEDELMPGDILCFYSSKAKTYIGHVGIYLGGSLYIHAQNEENGVIISNLDDPWLPRIFEARRIV